MHWSPQRSAKVMSNALLGTGLQGKEGCFVFPPMKFCQWEMMTYSWAKGREREVRTI